MSKKHNFMHAIEKILDRNRDGSYATQADRKQHLRIFVDDLFAENLKPEFVRNLKSKHIETVIKKWQAKNLATATIKNRLSALRYLAEKINKPNIIPNTNAALGIPARRYVSTTNKAIVNPDFSKIKDPRILISLNLQRVFGLRREESLKIKPHQADKGNTLLLQASWCKGGRERSVPIRTEEQRYWLDKAKELAIDFNYSLIPVTKNYKKHVAIYCKQLSRAGLKNMHGLRHAYAQARYKELTGWEAPINGGPSIKNLTDEQWETDHRARLIISLELGHCRKSIVVQYCGK